MTRKKPVRNVRFQHERDSAIGRRPLERFLLSNRIVTWILSDAAKWFLTALIWPRFFAPFRWQLTRHPLRITGLDPAFTGYRILQLSDFHVGKTRQSYLIAAIDKCLEEPVDLVVITGDLINYYPHSLPLLQTLLEHLVASARRANHGRGVPDGILAIFGNHDYHEYSWRHIGPRSAHRALHKRLVKIVQDNGIQLLRNQSVRIRRPAAAGPTHPPAELILVGLDEMWTGRAEPKAAFQGLSPQDPIICLQHNPDGIEFLKDYPWQIMLCGHSHGGQANFPLLGPLYVPMEHREYLSGFYRFPPLNIASGSSATTCPERTMFVSRGLGYSVPIRLRCPPEATLFTLSS